MSTFNLHFAKTQLSRLVDQALAGEEVIIAKAGKPLVRLVPIVPPASTRLLGALAGQVVESPDCWDVDPELEQLFYGEPVEPLKRVAEDVANTAE